jgi:hypothetical protein
MTEPTERSERRSGSAATTKEATRSQYWMLAVMVTFTSLGRKLLAPTRLRVGWRSRLALRPTIPA